MRYFNRPYDLPMVSGQIFGQVRLGCRELFLKIQLVGPEFLKIFRLLSSLGPMLPRRFGSKDPSFGQNVHTKAFHSHVCLYFVNDNNILMIPFRHFW